MSDMCGEKSSFGVRCDLHAGHDWPHAADLDDGAAITWEPIQATGLRRRIERLQDDLLELLEALDDASGYDPSSHEPCDRRVAEAIESCRLLVEHPASQEGA